MAPDSLHLGIALGPLAVYLVLLGCVHLSKRPFVATGARDMAALSVAISGFVVAGPMELFLPEGAANRFGGYVWLLLVAFYALCVTLWVLLLRPRLVIYNITAEQLRPILARVVLQLDKEARWAGESLVLPRLGVRLHVESSRSMRNAQLIAAGPDQSYGGWRRLEQELARALGEVKSPRNAFGFLFVAAGLLLAGLITAGMIRDTEAVAQALREMLRL